MKSIQYGNPWFKVIKEDQYHYIEENNAHNGAVILMLLNNQEFIFVEQFRRAIAKTVIELPRGYGESQESSLDAAIREAREETGYLLNIQSIKKIGSIYPNSAILTSNIDIYFADVSSQDMVSLSDDKEVSSVLYVSKDAIIKLIQNGEIQDSFSIAAICYWLMGNFKVLCAQTVTEEGTF